MTLRRLALSFLSFTALVATLHAQEGLAPPAPAAVSSQKTPDATGPREIRDLAYVTDGGERQKLDLYLPANSSGPRPLVAWIHGGGWETGSKDHCPARVLVARGYVAASIGYRLSQHAPYPAQIEDCKAAIRWLRAHAAQYGIDPERIGVWGASAGGHLSALLGTTGKIRDFDVGENLEQSSRVQCVIDWFGPTDFLHYGEPPRTGLDRPGSAVVKLLGGLVRENLEAAKRASPYYFVSADAAPFLIMHGNADPLVPLQQSEELQAALEKAGVESELRVIDGAAHGGSAFSAPDEQKAMVAFLDRHLQQKHAANPPPAGAQAR